MSSTREKIKEVALIFLAENGYEGTTLSEIAGQCGIKTPSFYGHFPSKESLFLEVWADLVSEYRSFMDNLLSEVEGKPAGDQALQLMKGYGDHFVSHPASYKLWARMLMFPPPQFRERVMEDSTACEKVIQEHIGRLLAKGVQRGELRSAPLEDLLASFAILKEGYVQWLFFYGPQDAEQQTRRIWRLLWGGFEGINK